MTGTGAGDRAGEHEADQPEGMISPEAEAALVAETVDDDHDPEDDDPPGGEAAPATGA